MSFTNSTVTATYYPSQEDALKFELRGIETPINEDLPEGYPAELVSPLSWTAAEMEQKKDEWIVQLSDQDLEALAIALRHFTSLEISPSEISPNTFPLPNELAKRLEKISEQCYSGKGFVILRGLQPRHFTDEQNAYLYAGISAYVAPERGFQDYDRTHVLCHIVNRTLATDLKKRPDAPAFTDGSMVFHTDSGDILSLYTKEVDEAGRTLIASSWTIYNELARTRPDLIKVLTEDWIMEENWIVKEVYEPKQDCQVSKLPLLFFHDGKLIMHYSRYPITGFGGRSRNPLLPPLTELQVEAMNTIHFLSEKNAICLPNEEGDILYLNNMSIIHAREALRSKVDGKPVLSGRHRLKLFLRDPKRAWSIPDKLKVVWERLYGPNQPDGTRVEKWLLDVKGVENPTWWRN